MTALKALALFAMFGVLPLTDSAFQALKEVGSFHVGGRTETLNGLPSRRSCSRPARRRSRSIRTASSKSSRCMSSTSSRRTQVAKCPLLLWHGGGLTGRDLGDEAGRQAGLAAILPQCRL